MDSLDEKINGTPVMEIDEPVSVRDRACPLFSKALSVQWLLIYAHLYVDEAFAAKNMPDLGHEVQDFKVYHWKLHNWRKLEKKITSPEFECGGHRWCVSRSAFSLASSQYLRI